MTEVTNTPKKSLRLPLADPSFVLPLREFVLDHVTPAGDALYREDIYPKDIVKRLAHQGFSTITLPQVYGRGERDFSCAVALFEEVAVGSAAVGVSLLTNFHAQTIIRLLGSKSLKLRYLIAFCNGLLAPYAPREFAHGSDIPRLRRACLHSQYHAKRPGSPSTKAITRQPSDCAMAPHELAARGSSRAGGPPDRH